MFMKRFNAAFQAAIAIFALSGSAVFFSACNKQEKPKEAPKTARSTPITTTKAGTRTLEIRENSVGYIESRNSPTISSEAMGRVKQLFVDNGAFVKAGDLLARLDDTDVKLRITAIQSDVNRLETLAANQERNIQRLRTLASQKVISENQMEDAEAQLKALREQITGARAQLGSAERDLEKTGIQSPVSGKIENRLISVGDFLTVGKPLFIISNEDKYQVHLPFPETVNSRIKVGQPVRLSLPSMPGKEFGGTISEVRPAINAGSKAIDAIINKNNPDGWKSGASIIASVLVDVHKNAVVVAPASIVLRPAGEVVYVVEGNLVRQRIVKIGERQNDVVEIISGLKDGEVVALDGAAFLSDGAPVKIQEPK
jgi:RND family efflux transporter MFP subunit